MRKNFLVASLLQGVPLPKMERLIELLKDGKWHSLEEIAEKMGVTPEKLEELLETLSEYQLVRY